MLILYFYIEKATITHVHSILLHLNLCSPQPPAPDLQYLLARLNLANIARMANILAGIGLDVGRLVNR